MDIAFSCNNDGKLYDIVIYAQYTNFSLVGSCSVM